jgi:hypothetical protein
MLKGIILLKATRTELINCIMKGNEMGVFRIIMCQQYFVGNKFSND